MVIVVPATAATMPFHVHVDVSFDVDVVDAGAADIVRAHIGTAVIDLRALPGTAGLGVRAGASTSGARSSAATSAAPATATIGRVHDRGRGEAGQSEEDQRCREKFADLVSHFITPLLRFARNDLDF